MHENQHVPQQFGDFKVIRAIGQGAIGVVYEGLQESTGERVAIKAFSPWIGLTTAAYSKFQTQIEKLAQTKQVGIVQAITCGQSGTRPYYIMQFVDGPSLNRIMLRTIDSVGKQPRAKLTDSNRLIGDKCPDWAVDWMLARPPEADASNSKSKGISHQRFGRMAAFLAEAAEVLSIAHGQGLMHGDLKPSNLFLARDRSVYISDFALARLLELPGVVIGGNFSVSPVYSPPETFLASTLPADPRSDVYALGAVLYELLTRKPPYTGGRDHIVSQILRDDPPRPRSIDRQIPPRLEAICRKAMERKASNRYQTASQLADDLRSFATQRAVSAREISFVKKGVRWSTRYPAHAFAFLCCLLLTGFTSKVAIDVYQATVSQHAERTREATFRGLLQSFLGDLPAMQRKTEELRKLGVEPWILGLMMGECHLVAGNVEDAIDGLQQALKQRSDSAAAMVLLVEAYARAERVSELEAIEKKLATAAPTDIVDRLFHAHWLAHADTPREVDALCKIRESTDKQSDLLAKVLLAFAYCRLFKDTDDRAYYDSVLIITHGLGEPNALHRLLYFRVTKDVVRVMHFEELEELEDFQGRTEDQLKSIDRNHGDSLASARAWAWQALSIDDSDLRIHAFRRSIELYQRNHAVVPTDLSRAYALELLVGDQIEEAVRELEALQMAGATGLEFLTAVTLAQRDGNVQHAAVELNRLRQREKSQPLLIGPVAYLLLGMSSESRALFLAATDATYLERRESSWHQKLHRFTIGDLTAAQIIEEANKPQKSNFRMSEAQFQVGMKQLAERKRSLAKLHFEECLGCGVFTSVEYLYARTILEMWRGSPDWPLWIVAEDRAQPE